MAANWIDLLDPSPVELRAACPPRLEETALELLLATPQHNDEPRPTLQGHGNYVFGIFLLARALPEEDSIYYQEVGLVLTHDTILTVRKTPPGHEPYDIAPIKAVVRETDSAGMVAYRVVDAIAEAYLDRKSVV